MQSKRIEILVSITLRQANNRDYTLNRRYEIGDGGEDL